MKLFLSYIRLIRPFNLTMIVFTLYMVRFCFILPVLSFSSFHLQVSEWAFALFAIAFGLIAAAGYIINDYYDVEIDRINKPGKEIIGSVVSKSSALTSYWILNVVGIIIGFWSCHKAGTPILGTLFLFYLIGLWLYSYKLKSTFLFGNLLISVFLGIVPLASAYIEAQADLKMPEAINSFIILPIRTGAWAIAGFAFFSTLIREIVKDMEDLEGDMLAGCYTMPIVLGNKKVKVLVLILVFLLIALLGILQYNTWSSGWRNSFYYILVFIQLPCLIVIWKMLKASIPKDFHRISTWLKIIMLTGICYLFVFAYECYITLQYIRLLSHSL
jgi:4-hydroxybenzoate polyprenyltransferase